MSTLREVLQQALKALEVLTDTYDDNAVGIEIDAIHALRAALAEHTPKQEVQEPEPVGGVRLSDLPLDTLVYTAQPAPQQAAPAVLSATQMRALQDARTTAMHWTAKARVPECGEFGRIAQDLDCLVNELAAPQQKVQEPVCAASLEKQE